MSRVYFARPRWEYGSYTDLYQLIALSGYPLIYFDEIDPSSDHTYIMTMVNGENQGGWQQPRARIILWDLEWRLDAVYPQVPGVSEVWASDRWYAGQIGARYVVLGSHPDLNLNPDEQADKRYDVAMLAYMTHRRETIANDLRQRGVAVAPRGWGLERHTILIQTRAMLHVHQHDWAATVAPQRFALAAAYRMPLISERACDPAVFADGVLWSDYARLADVMTQVSWADIRAYGEALHELLCVKRTFKSEVEQAL